MKTTKNTLMMCEMLPNVEQATFTTKPCDDVIK